LVTPTDSRTPQKNQRRAWWKIMGYGSYAASALLATTYSSTLFNFSQTRCVQSRSLRPRRFRTVLSRYKLVGHSNWSTYSPKQSTPHVTKNCGIRIVCYVSSTGHDVL